MKFHNFHRPVDQNQPSKTGHFAGRHLAVQLSRQAKQPRWHPAVQLSKQAKQPNLQELYLRWPVAQHTRAVAVQLLLRQVEEATAKHCPVWRAWVMLQWQQALVVLVFFGWFGAARESFSNQGKDIFCP